MKKLRTWEIIVGVLLFSLAIIGGTEKSQIIDDVRLVTAMGYDLKDQTHFEGTVEAPIFNPDLTLTQEVYSETASLSQINRMVINAESPYEVVSGKLQVVLFDIPLAKQGIMDRIDTLYRDPAVGERVYLAIVDGKSKDVLSKQFEQNFDDGTYLSEMIEQNTNKSFLPTTNLHEFSVSFYTKGTDPCLPLLKIVNNKIQIEGVAYFDDGQYKGFINKDDAIYLKMLKESFSKGSLSVNKPHSNELVSIENVGSATKYKVVLVNGQPHIKVIQNVDGNITETYNTEKMTDKEVEKLFEAKIKKESQKLIRRFQKENCDPLSLGYQVRIHDRKWNFEQWKNQYSEVPVSVEVHVKIRERGLLKT